MKNNDELEKHIKVIDSPVGSGKTSWAIDYINSLPETQKVIYISPFLNECKRIKDACYRKFFEPDKRIGSGKKRNHFLELIRKEKDIASTHSLFSNMDDEVLEALRCTDYILILDEAFQVLDKFDMWSELSRVSEDKKENLTQKNISTLIKKGFIEVNEEYNIKWIEEECSLDKYNKLKNLSDRGLAFLIRDSLLLWSFPYEVFLPGIFKKVFILTFLFKWQMQKYYYDYFEIKYSLHHIELKNDEYILVKTKNFDYEIEWKKNVKKLINVLENHKINKIGDFYVDNRGRMRNSALSKSWYIRNKAEIPRLRNNIINYFSHITKSRNIDRLWTCFSSYKDIFKHTNLSINDKKQWTALNSRSTNEWMDKSVLAYPVNIFINPFYNAFFQVRNIEMDSDGFAVSTLIQWIFRSRIRNGLSIQLYLPSARMRKLLKEFLDTTNEEQNNEKR